MQTVSKALLQPTANEFHYLSCTIELSHKHTPLTMNVYTRIFNYLVTYLEWAFIKCVPPAPDFHIHLHIHLYLYSIEWNVK